MTIEAWENHTKVMCPDGHMGWIQVTRRERKLMDAGKIKEVSVLGTDGIERFKELSTLVLVEEPDEELEDL